MTSSSTSSIVVRRPRAPVLLLACRLSAAASSASSLKIELDLVQREELLVLLDDSVLRLGRGCAPASSCVERVEATIDRQAADELRDQAVLEQVVVRDVLQQLLSACSLVGSRRSALKPSERLLADARAR